ncbi:MAG: hypothetical protein AUJ92_13810 [Armatimonadetes bacterium CG2_30_59_28]|nr:discoidin domain-containing protein [Armatimonadota bacterium]OIO92612.1 MAG: hypothetical protein AUJ92_13810 [Armatimonadetes bacterium CG2_30_59_28]PIU64707.1 MAG: hypothetical protein COS85_11510 [Armatimonadetes bacterium CG07_land_8_20_14_0_80_59_28]PIX45539.1 MAG: hypothetical protein COZ56_01615 [Armatimonadetes bacterium CG_4_8_14_3_um_filter_58_9]PIY48533.1 MAG: hypothetical protein COZ05_02840 [Armatimonadetes bacterium CG_4_10_14_3_um_filter_59_10]
MKVDCILLCFCSMVYLGCVSASRVEDAASPHPQWKNLASGSTVQFNTPPNSVSAIDPDDVLQLVDGKLCPATPIWYDKSTAGWALLDPTVFTIDLGAVRPIRGVALHRGAGQAGVEWPTSLHIHVSDDGKKYSSVGNLMELLSRSPPGHGLCLVLDRHR